MNDALKIDMEELINAFEDHSGYFDYYLDLKNGNVVPLMSDDFDQEPEYIDGYTIEAVEGDPDRFRYIFPVESWESFKIMEEFVETVVNDVIKNRLKSALSRKKPFRNFKDEIHHLPEVSEEWFSFHDEAMSRVVYNWLEENDVKAVLVRRSPESG